MGVCCQKPKIWTRALVGDVSGSCSVGRWCNPWHIDLSTVMLQAISTRIVSFGSSHLIPSVLPPCYHAKFLPPPSWFCRLVEWAVFLRVHVTRQAHLLAHLSWWVVPSLIRPSLCSFVVRLEWFGVLWIHPSLLRICLGTLLLVVGLLLWNLQ